MLKVAIGLAIKIKNAEIANAGSITVPNFEGKESKPKQKKIIICINHEIPSRKCTRLFLCLILLLPTIIPVKYTLRYPLPPTHSVKP